MARIASRFGVRDLVSLLAVIFAGYAAVAAYNQGLDIQEGRKVGSSLSCAVGAALTDGGQRFVAASAAGAVPPKLAEFLRQYGYPTKAERKVQARLAAAAYARFISDSIVRQVGPKARGIVMPNGTFDCDRFAALAKIPK